MLYLRFITTLLPCFVLWPYLYSQFIAEQLVTLLNVVHCALYHVCNNHIGGQSDIATKNFLKQNQTKSTMLIGFGGDLVDCFVLLFFFLFNSKFTEKCQIKFYIFDCFEIQESIDITESKYPGPDIRSLGFLPFYFSKDWNFYDSGQSQTLILGLIFIHQPVIYS